MRTPWWHHLIAALIFCGCLAIFLNQTIELLKGLGLWSR